MNKKESLETVLSTSLEQKTLSDEAKWHFLKRVESQHDEANKVLVRRIVALVLTWGILIGISSGVVSSVKIGDSQLTELKELLGFGPLIIALIQYGIFSSLIAISVTEKAVRKCYYNLASDLAKNHLHFLTNYPTFFSIEEYIDRASPKGIVGILHIIFSASLLLLIFGLALFIITHASYLSYSVGTWWWPYTTCSVGIGAVIWLRGLLAFITVSKW